MAMKHSPPKQPKGHVRGQTDGKKVRSSGIPTTKASGIRPGKMPPGTGKC